MNEPTTAMLSPASPFATVPPTATEHFKLYFYAAVLNLIARVTQSCDSLEVVFERFPFLVGYNNELAERGAAGLSSEDAAGWWRESMRAWEKTAPANLPLRALGRLPAIDHSTLTLLMIVGLTEEDARFGFLFDALQGTTGQHRPTVGLLNSLWSDFDDRAGVRKCLERCRELGIIRAVNPDAPRAEWALQVPAPLWDAVRGETPARPAPGLLYRDPAQLAELGELILPGPVLQQVGALPALLAMGVADAVSVRGPQRGARRTVAGAVARALGRGVLEIDGSARTDDERWRLAGPLATLMNAMPLIVLDLAPGETAELPALSGYDGPLAMVLGTQGGVTGPGTERAITLTLELPDVEARRRHWRAGLGTRDAPDLHAVSHRFRMTGGNIRRAARLAQSYAALRGHSEIGLADAREGSRALNRQVLDTLAVRLPAIGDWDTLAVCAETKRELDHFEARCRHRERLRGAPGTPLNCGVRALFTGPSGTGKTLAARLSASVLQTDIYRLDLSSVVNKYIGETEKNLNRVFARAEELDVILLLDEGDALLTQRTHVQTSNDRYANLETNFLLQRLESFEGILIVTTNAADRIDGAFQRRMDVVVEFRPPETAERRAIWQLHLPPSNTIDPGVLHDVAARCTLTGGQIRNAALHASLLALDDDGCITTNLLIEAVQREYRKSGAVCPLRLKVQ